MTLGVQLSQIAVRRSDWFV